MALNLNNIQAGTHCLFASAQRQEFEPMLFLGFTACHEKYAKTPKFDTLKEAKAFYDVKKNAELEDIGDSLGLPYGHSVYAMFRAVGRDGETYDFGCYLFEGRWTCGSGADRIQLASQACL